MEMKRIEMLSPSSINTFLKCKRLFYLRYKLGMKTPDNIHIFKGRVVHEVIEKLFDAKKYRDNMYVWCSNKFEELWVLPDELQLGPNDDMGKHKQECLLMIRNFCQHFENKVELAILDGKVKDKNHAWNLLKPRLREYKIFNENLKFHGIIDSVEHNWDDTVYIVDYKTSKMFGNAVGDDYIRQLQSYALLYYLDTGIKPSYACINYLRYGEVHHFKVDDAFIDSAKKQVEEVWKYIENDNIDDYSCCDNSYCEHHLLDLERKIGGK